MSLRRRSRASFASWSWLWPLAVSGCLASTSPTPSSSPPIPPRPELSCQRQGAERIETANFRGGSQPDVVKVFHKNADGSPPLFMSCKEVDLNGDGRKDVLLYLDKYGRKLREEFDHDKDGVADQKSFYEAGVLVRDEHDKDSDGKIDLIEHFADGKRVRIERVSPAPDKSSSAASPTPAPTAAPTSAPTPPAAATPAAVPTSTPTPPAAATPAATSSN